MAIVCRRPKLQCRSNSQRLVGGGHGYHRTSDAAQKRAIRSTYVNVAVHRTPSIVEIIVGPTEHRDERRTVVIEDRVSEASLSHHIDVVGRRAPSNVDDGFGAGGQNTPGSAVVVEELASPT